MIENIYKNDLGCVCRFYNDYLYFVIMDKNGKIHKSIKCEDETVYNYFLEVFNL